MLVVRIVALHWRQGALSAIPSTIYSLIGTVLNVPPTHILSIM